MRTGFDFRDLRVSSEWRGHDDRGWMMLFCDEVVDTAKVVTRCIVDVLLIQERVKDMKCFVDVQMSRDRWYMLHTLRKTFGY